MTEKYRDEYMQGTNYMIGPDHEIAQDKSNSEEKHS